MVDPGEGGRQETGHGNLTGLRAGDCGMLNVFAPYNAMLIHRKGGSGRRELWRLTHRAVKIRSGSLA